MVSRATVGGRGDFQHSAGFISAAFVERSPVDFGASIQFSAAFVERSSVDFGSALVIAASIVVTSASLVQPTSAVVQSSATFLESAMSRCCLVDAVPPDGRFVELGVASGAYAEAVCARRPDVHYLGVDRWSDHHDVIEMRAAWERVRRFPRAQFCRATFEEVARTTPEDSLDAVYVDGYAHTGQDNGRTLDLWWPKVKRGGFLCGHDFDLEKWPHTFKAVTYFAGHRGLDIEVIPEPGGFASWRIWRPLTDRVLVAGSCVLVGNGPSLADSGMGSQIDAFDEVVRFNDFKLSDDLAPHVGRKTTLWSCYGANAQRARQDPPARVIYLHGAKAAPQWCRPEELWRVPLAFYQRVKEEVLAVTERVGDQRDKLLPSAGLVTLKWLLELHRVRHVTLAGFDHFSREGVGARHHYWLFGQFGAPVEHDGAAERLLVEDLREAGRVSILTRA